MPSESFLYVIASSSEGPVKLGFSAEPEHRLRQLQTGHANRLRLYHKEPVAKALAKLFERRMHRDISYARTHGEWFAMTTAQAIAQVQFTIIEYGLELGA